MPGQRCANRLQRFGGALHDIVAHSAVHMNIQVSRDQGRFGIRIARLALRAAMDRGDVPVVDGDLRMLDEFAAAQEPACRNCAGHSVPFSSCPVLVQGKEYSKREMP